MRRYSNPGASLLSCGRYAMNAGTIMQGDNTVPGYCLRRAVDISRPASTRTIRAEMVRSATPIVSLPQVPDLSHPVIIIAQEYVNTWHWASFEINIIRQAEMNTIAISKHPGCYDTWTHRLENKRPAIPQWLDGVHSRKSPTMSHFGGPTSDHCWMGVKLPALSSHVHTQNARSMQGLITCLAIEDALPAGIPKDTPVTSGHHPNPVGSDLQGWFGPSPPAAAIYLQLEYSPVVVSSQDLITRKPTTQDLDWEAALILVIFQINRMQLATQHGGLI